MMKKNILKYVLLSMTFFLGACNDFFNVETKNVLDHDGYITEESEMYSGYIGIMTKVQAIGDKVIYLTDTRGELLGLYDTRILCIIWRVMFVAW